MTQPPCPHTPLVDQSVAASGRTHHATAGTGRADERGKLPAHFENPPANLTRVRDAAGCLRCDHATLDLAPAGDDRRTMAGQGLLIGNSVIAYNFWHDPRAAQHVGWGAACRKSCSRLARERQGCRGSAASRDNHPDDHGEVEREEEQDQIARHLCHSGGVASSWSRWHSIGGPCRSRRSSAQARLESANLNKSTCLLDVSTARRFSFSSGHRRLGARLAQPQEVTSQHPHSR